MATIIFSGYIGSMEISTLGNSRLLKFTVHEHHKYSPEPGKYIETGKTVHYCNIWGDRIDSIKDIIQTGAAVLVYGDQETTFSKEVDSEGKPLKRYTSIRVFEIGLLPHKIESITLKPSS